MKPEDLRKLHQKKYREELGHFLVEGEHPVRELVRAAAQDARLRDSILYCTEAQAHLTSQLQTRVVSARQMAQISETRSPQGVVAVVPLPRPPPAGDGERAIYLHEVQDPGNLGTILRTLAWFGGYRCLLSPGSVDPFNGKAVRASMGAIFHVPVEIDVPLESLPQRFSRIACLDLDGEPVTGAAFRDCGCFLFGNEARGVPREAVDALRAQVFSISGTGVIDSLNVAAAVAICQYELHRPMP